MSIPFTNYRSSVNSQLLEEYFGSLTAQMYTILLHRPKTLKMIVQEAKVPVNQVKEILSTMIQFEFVTFQSFENKQCEYSLNFASIEYMLYYPRYILYMYEEYGLEAKLLVQTLILNGSMENGVLCQKVASSLMNDKKLAHDSKSIIDKVCEVLDKLTKIGFIVSLPDVTDEMIPVPICNQNEKLTSQSDIEDDDEKYCYWKINHEKFLCEFRNQFILKAIERRFDSHASLLIKHLFRLSANRSSVSSPKTNAVSTVQLKDSVVGDVNGSHVFKYFDQYIKIIEEDPNFILLRSNDFRNDLAVDLNGTMKKLVIASISMIAQHRFGFKAARIFRLIVDKVYCEMEQIQQVAMMPDKEAKQLTYKLLEEKFVNIHGVKSGTSTSSFGSQKNFFLFFVDLPATTGRCLDLCYQSLYNCADRRLYEQKDYEHLYEKKIHTDNLTECFEQTGATGEQILQLVNEYISRAELLKLHSLEHITKTIQKGEMELINTILLFNLYKAHPDFK